MDTVALIPVFALLHTLGALIGAGTTLFAEIFYTKAAADGVIDHHERKYLRHLYHGLTYGMVLVLISASALMVLEYLVPDAPQDVLAAPFWALQLLTFSIILFSYFLSKKQIQWWIASAAILTGWWLMLAIDFGFLNTFGFFSILFLYIIATIIVAGVLGYLRVLMRPKDTSIHTS
jgi:hypothetical protein